MRIAIVGGGPAGSWASIQLAKIGHDVTLFDPRAPWEKPCGGGITTKALDRFGIFSSDLPRMDIERITVFFGIRIRSVSPRNRHSPWCLGSSWGKHLLDEAIRSGATSLTVTRIQERNGRWILSGREGEYETEFLVGRTERQARSAGPWDWLWHPMSSASRWVTSYRVIFRPR
jgi:geranylgeranyl reductase